MSAPTIEVYGSDTCSLRTKAAAVLAVRSTFDGLRVVLTERDSQGLRAFLPTPLVPSGGLRLYNAKGIPKDRFVIALDDGSNGSADGMLDELSDGFDLVVTSVGAAPKKGKKGAKGNGASRVLVGAFDGAILKETGSLRKRLGDASFVGAVPDRMPGTYAQTIANAKKVIGGIGDDCWMLPLFGYVPFTVPATEELDARLWDLAAQVASSVRPPARSGKAGSKPDPGLIGQATSATGRDIEASGGPAEVPAGGLAAESLEARGSAAEALAKELDETLHAGKSEAERTEEAARLEAEASQRRAGDAARARAEEDAARQGMAEQDEQRRAGNRAEAEALGTRLAGDLQQAGARVAEEGALEQAPDEEAGRAEAESVVEEQAAAREAATPEETAQDAPADEAVGQEAEGGSPDAAEEAGEAGETSPPEAEAEAVGDAAGAEPGIGAATAVAGDLVGEGVDLAQALKSTPGEAAAAEPEAAQAGAKPVDGEDLERALQHQPHDGDIDVAAHRAEEGGEGARLEEALEQAAHAEDEREAAEEQPAAGEDVERALQHQPHDGDIDVAVHVAEEGGEGARLEEALDEAARAEAEREAAEALRVDDEDVEHALQHQPHDGDIEGAAHPREPEKVDKRPEAEEQKQRKTPYKITRKEQQQSRRLVNADKVAGILELESLEEIIERSKGVKELSFPDFDEAAEVRVEFSSLNEYSLRKMPAQARKKHGAYVAGVRGLALAKRAAVQEEWNLERVLREFANEMFAQADPDAHKLDHWFMNTVWLTEAMLELDRQEEMFDPVNRLLELTFRGKKGVHTEVQVKTLRVVMALLLTKIEERMPEGKGSERSYEVVTNMLGELPEDVASGLFTEDAMDTAAGTRIGEEAGKAREAFGEMA